MSDTLLTLVDPPITGYHARAFPLSIISGHPACWSWTLEHFIQLRCSQRFVEPQNVLDFTAPAMLDFPTPWLNVQRIDRPLLDRYIPDLQQFVIDCIQSEHYVHLYVDEYFVPHRVPFQRAHILHDLLIHGYNDELHEFHIAGFDEQGFYRQTTISYQQFQQAISLEHCLPRSPNPVLLVSLNTHVDYELRVSNVVEELTHYYNGTLCASQHYGLIPSSEPVYGLNVYEALCQYIQHGADHQLELETRPFQLLIEHKQLMRRRLDFLFAHQHLSSASKFEQTYAELARNIVSVRNKIIKYQLTEQERLLTAAQEQLRALQTKERECVQRIIDALH